MSNVTVLFREHCACFRVTRKANPSPNPVNPAIVVRCGMASTAALLHTHNDGLRLGRALETLRACEEFYVVDHASSDATVRVARQYGACVLSFSSWRDALQATKCERILCIKPNESVSEALEASLFELRFEPVHSKRGYSLHIHRESANGWVKGSSPELRVIAKDWPISEGGLPVQDTPQGSSEVRHLAGCLYSFSRP